MATWTDEVEITPTGEAGQSFRVTLWLSSHTSQYGRVSWGGTFDAGSTVGMISGEYTFTIGEQAARALFDVRVAAGPRGLTVSGTVTGQLEPPF